MPDAQAPAHEPIDAVYTWEDANHPQYREQFRKYREAVGIPDPGAPSSHDGQRLRYSLRSLERHAPWVRQVYLVTNGPAPEWMVASHPRLTLVRHQDLFKDASLLPVFNPAALAWQLFRIPGLSRRFLYCSDDCFLGQAITLSDFVNGKGGTRFFAESTDIPTGDASLAFSERLLNARLGDHSPRKQVAQTPRFLDKTFLEEVHRLWEGQIKRTASHRFPHPEDVSLETLYFYFLLESPMQYGVHEAVAAAADAKRYRRLELSSQTSWKQLMAIAFNRPQFLCLSDGREAVSQKTAASIGSKVNWFLRLSYWRRSVFEKK
jgi:hypothetical protein